MTNCRTLGWPFIGVARDVAKSARLRAEGAVHVYADFTNLGSFFELLHAETAAEV